MNDTQIEEIEFDIGLKNEPTKWTECIIYTQDANSSFFSLKLSKDSITFDKVRILFKSINSKSIDISIDAEKKEAVWVAEFKTEWISSNETVTAYVYAYKNDKSYDVGSFKFDVAVSEIDKSIEKVEVVYWKQLDDLLNELREGIAEGKIVGQSAYELWLKEGNSGTVSDFLTSLKGREGTDGASNYELWLKEGNEGTVSDYLNWVRLNDSNFWVEDDVQKEIEELSDKYEQR